MDYRRGWRVMVMRDDSTFATDRLKVYAGKRTDEGFYPVLPIEIAMGELQPPSVDRDVKPTLIDMDLAVALFNQLGYALLGEGEPYHKIRQLEADLSRTRSMLEKLIDGIGRLGGNNDRSSS